LSATPSSPLAEVDWTRFDFVDLGCSRGGSIGYCADRFGARRGLGIDRSAEKVAEARKAGFDAVVADALDLPHSSVVRFVSMLDFLEHLPDLEAVERAIAAAAGAATDFLFIRHPSFEGEAYLGTLGLRQYWWHWRGHTAHIRVSDYCRMFERLGLRQYCLHYREPVEDSGHPSILPRETPPDQGPYDPSLHPPKPHIAFSEALWRAQDIFVALRGFEPEEWTKIVTEPRPRS
jgi:SAM-dependent methyltransferase